ncbi:hypothetical protein Tco_0132887 [Tanacetum coccineum]
MLSGYSNRARITRGFSIATGVSCEESVIEPRLYDEVMCLCTDVVSRRNLDQGLFLGRRVTLMSCAERDTLRGVVIGDRILQVVSELRNSEGSYSVLGYQVLEFFDCDVADKWLRDGWRDKNLKKRQTLPEPLVKEAENEYSDWVEDQATCGIVGNKLWRLDDVTSKVVLYRNMGFNESGEYKKTFIGSGVGTGSMQVLQGDEFEVEPQDGHTFEVEPHGNVDHVVGSQEYREDSNEAAFAVAAVEKIYAHESLTFNNTVACEVISKWKAGLKDDMDARSDVYVLSNDCKKCGDDSDGYYWESTPGYGEVAVLASNIPEMYELHFAVPNFQWPFLDVAKGALEIISKSIAIVPQLVLSQKLWNMKLFWAFGNGKFLILRSEDRMMSLIQSC